MHRDGAEGASLIDISSSPGDPQPSFCLGGGPRTQKNVIGKLRLHFGERSFPGFCSYIEVPEDLCLRARDAHHLVVEANTIGAAGSVHGKGAVEVVDDHMK